MEPDAPEIATPENAGPLESAPEIPDKLFFRMGEVSRLLGLEPYVLRFWEAEFPTLAPRKSDTGRRMYRRKDVEQLLIIKQLLYERRFTIAGARQHLRLERKAAPSKPAPPRTQTELFAADPLPAIRKELASILELLNARTIP